MKIQLLLFTLLSLHSCLQAQSYRLIDNQYSSQLGFSFKALLELGITKQHPNPVFRLTANAGIGANFAVDWLYPSFNVELQLYNGGEGSKRNVSKKSPLLDIDIITAFTLTCGSRNLLANKYRQRLIDRNIPLYYFSDYVFPALQNPYDYSFSWGINIIFAPANHKKTTQRVGFFNAHVLRGQFSYYNDGGVPMTDLNLGDKKDRFYTGGGVFSYHGNRNSSLELVELSYHKFSGYSKNAFEVSNKLFLSYMNYNDREQKYFNKSIWNLSFANPSKGYGIRISSYNSVLLDIQHYIHWGLFNSYHMVPYRSYWAVSGIFYNIHSQIGIR